MQVDQIAQKIFIDAGFEHASFKLQSQFHFITRITPLIMRAGQQMAIIQVIDDRPTTFFYKTKPYAFTKDSFRYCGESVCDLLTKSCVESHTVDGSSLFMFNIK